MENSTIDNVNISNSDPDFIKQVTVPAVYSFVEHLRKKEIFDILTERGTITLYEELEKLPYTILC